MVYHVLNRSSAGMMLFEDDADYEAFEQVLAEAVEFASMRLCAYCLMPDHWHLIVRPRRDGDLSRFVGWLTLTHTQRWRAHRRAVGDGRLYQGRFKSFLIQRDEHFITVCRHVERNALHAGLVNRAQDWPWSSLWLHVNGPCGDDAPALSGWPIDRPRGWVRRVNAALGAKELEAVQRSIKRGSPYGSPAWVKRTAARLGLESTLRPRGRPRGAKVGPHTS